MELEALQKNLDAKLKLLAYKQEKGKGIVDKANATTIGRHRDALVCLAKEADEIKLKIEEKKIAKGEQMDEVNSIRPSLLLTTANLPCSEIASPISLVISVSALL
ncbi:hypothetical protein AWC38_SpisGene527 [Stylophora pistillata]|uniref:Uncharacterized protein n=1 Tax=Stylophora pistillata TaxID=50429 RepID=A0A2B4SXB0_STYPI|nr:hypothetical protein AWC38_SpisGene527 [Stylophora pistillata]